MGTDPGFLLPTSGCAVTMKGRVDFSTFRERTSPVAVSVAVVGATGAVGEIMRQVLVEHNFPLRGIKFLASERSAGKTIVFNGKKYTVEPIRPEALAVLLLLQSN